VERSGGRQGVADALVPGEPFLRADSESSVVAGFSLRRLSAGLSLVAG